MAKVLAIRFSAIGDVAMIIPVIHSFALQYPEHQITVLSRESLRRLFVGMPDNVSFIGADLHGEHKGIMGMNKLFGELNQLGFDYIADLHDVLRSQYLRFRFKLVGKKTAHIRKGRKGKRKLIRQHNKVMENQPSSFVRYAQVFKQLGFPLQLNFTSIYGDSKGDLSLIESFAGEKEEGVKWVGVAPFAKHQGKIYPIEFMEKAVMELAQRDDIKIFLFGSGKEEQATFDRWSYASSNVVSTIGALNMSTELILMSYLNVMVSMDSANMHLASLTNIPVISIWGSTHPYGGFMGWKQLPINTVQVDLPCRPCSVFGNKPCMRKDYACLYQITPQMIIDKVESIID